MKPGEFPEVNLRIAENQPEFVTLPANYNKQTGAIVYCFELTQQEAEVVMAEKRIYFKQMIGKGPMQPIHPSVLKEELL